MSNRGNKRTSTTYEQACKSGEKDHFAESLTTLNLLYGLEAASENPEVNYEQAKEYCITKLDTALRLRHDTEQLELQDSSVFERDYRDLHFVIQILDAVTVMDEGLFEIMSNGAPLSLLNVRNVLASPQGNEFLKWVQPIVMASIEEDFVYAICNSLGEKRNIDLKDIKERFGSDPLNMNMLYHYLSRVGFEMEKSEAKVEKRKPNDVADALRTWKKADQQPDRLYRYNLQTEGCRNRLKALEVIRAEKLGTYTGLHSARSQSVLFYAALGDNHPESIHQLITCNGEIPRDDNLHVFASAVVKDVQAGVPSVEEIDALAQSLDSRFILKHLNGEIARSMLAVGEHCMRTDKYLFTSELIASFRRMFLDIGQQVFNINTAQDSPDKIRGVIYNKIGIMINKQEKSSIEAFIIVGLIYYMDKYEEWTDKEKISLKRGLFELIESEGVKPEYYLNKVEYPEGVNGVGDLDRQIFADSASFAASFLCTQICGAVSNPYLYIPDGLDVDMKHPGQIVKQWFGSTEAARVVPIPGYPLPNGISTLGSYLTEKSVIALSYELVTALRKYVFEHEPIYPHIPYPKALIQILPIDIESMPLAEVIHLQSKVEKVFDKAWLEVTKELITSTALEIANGGRLSKAIMLTAANSIGDISDMHVSRVLESCFKQLDISTSLLEKLSEEELTSFKEHLRIIFQEDQKNARYYLQAASEDEYRIISELLGGKNARIQPYSTIGSDFISYETILSTAESILGEGEQSIEVAKQLYRRLSFTLYHTYKMQATFENNIDQLTQLIFGGYMLGEHRAMEILQNLAFDAVFNGQGTYQLISPERQSSNLKAINHQRELIRLPDEGITRVLEEETALIQSLGAINSFRSTLLISEYVDNLMRNRQPEKFVSIPPEYEERVLTAFSRILPGIGKQALLTAATILMSSDLHNNLSEALAARKARYSELTKQDTLIVQKINTLWSELVAVAGIDLRPSQIHTNNGSLPRTSSTTSLNSVSILELIHGIQAKISTYRKQLESSAVSSQLEYWPNSNRELEQFMSASPNRIKLIKSLSQNLKTTLNKAQQLNKVDSEERINTWLEILSIIDVDHLHYPLDESIVEALTSSMDQTANSLEAGLLKTVRSHILFNTQSSLSEVDRRALLATLVPGRNMVVVDTAKPLVNILAGIDVTSIVDESDNDRLLTILDELIVKVQFIANVIEDLRDIEETEEAMPQTSDDSQIEEARGENQQKPKKKTRKKAPRRRGLVVNDDLEDPEHIFQFKQRNRR